MQPAKQKRSQERVEKILAVADQILCSGSISDITIANVSKVSELKRTSTYKFFETPDEIKMALIEKYLDACSLHLSNNLSSKVSSEYQQCIMDCCEIIHEFFRNQSMIDFCHMFKLNQSSFMGLVYLLLAIDQAFFNCSSLASPR